MAQGSVKQANQRGRRRLIALSNNRGPLLWQMELLPRLARQLPRIQFIATSHSPLLVGSLERRNIVIARQRWNGSSDLQRAEVDVSRLDADLRACSDSDRIRADKIADMASEFLESRSP